MSTLAHPLLRENGAQLNRKPISGHPTNNIAKSVELNRFLQVTIRFELTSVLPGRRECYWPKVNAV
jgi:hypothetical protein